MFQTISLRSKFSSLGIIADFQIFKEITMRLSNHKCNKNKYFKEVLVIIWDFI